MSGRDEPRIAVEPSLLREVRAVVFALVALSVSVVLHSWAHGGAPAPTGILAGAGLTLGLGVLVANRRRGLPVIGGALTVAQAVLHVVFSLSEGPGHVMAPPQPTGAMLGAHVLAGVLTAGWLFAGEAAVWRVARWLARSVPGLARLFALASRRVSVPAPRRVRPGLVAAAVAVFEPTWLRSAPRRGPPRTAAAGAALATARQWLLCPARPRGPPPAGTRLEHLVTLNADPPRELTAADTAAEPPLDTPAATADARPPRPARWALLRRLHFYAGIFVAPFLFVAALTGLAYTLAPQLNQLVYGHELTVDSVRDTKVPLADQVAAARKAHPDGTLTTVSVLDDPEATTQISFSTPALAADDKASTVYVDPYTGEVRGTLTTWYNATPLQTWLDSFHRTLNLGDTGRLYSELAASWLWVIALGGFALWIGRKRAYRGTRGRTFRPDLKAKGVRRTRGWHAAVGLWIIVGLLFLSATGLTWSQYAGARFGAALDAVQGHAPELDTVLSGPKAHHGATTATGPRATDLPDGVSLDQVLRAAGPMTGRIDVTIPADSGTAYSVAQDDGTWPVGFDQVAVDPRSGDVTQRVEYEDWPFLAKLTKVGIRAHMGELFGVVNQILLAGIALGLLCVIVWGYRMWWQRRPTRADRKAPLGSPPPRGGWRTLPRWFLVVGVPVTLFVAWAMPLLGLTLGAFLVFDLLVGAFRWALRTPAPRLTE
ncbi:PepSY domain-containing protein [Cryptosporangium sp. NPDC051539]|uniref:PepSY domain-containing protein n=1 Tax=Cryptosporangium sp. NPDC051539 TaxID=3363962 RepID=UPI003795A27F